MRYGAPTLSQAVASRSRGEPWEGKGHRASRINQQQAPTWLLPWGAPSASTGRAPLAPLGKRAACKCLYVYVSSRESEEAESLKDSGVGTVCSN